MINVAGVAEELATSPKTFAGLYLLLRDYIGRQVTITHSYISRTGELTYVSHNDSNEVYYTLGQIEVRRLFELDCKVEVKVDERWKTIVNGSSIAYKSRSIMFGG